jgi:hypothetical protein
VIRKFIFTLLRVLEKDIGENGWEYLSEFLDVRYVKRDKQCVCHTIASPGIHMGYYGMPGRYT